MGGEVGSDLFEGDGDLRGPGALFFLARGRDSGCCSRSRPCVGVVEHALRLDREVVERFLVVVGVEEDFDRIVFADRSVPCSGFAEDISQDGLMTADTDILSWYQKMGVNIEPVPVELFAAEASCASCH